MFIDKYNHDDYIVGMDAPQQVFRPVLEIMEGIRNGSNSSKFQMNSVRQKDLDNIDFKDLWVFWCEQLEHDQ